MAKVKAVKLPHGANAIAKQHRKVDTLKANLGDAQHALDDMLRENAEAERAASITAARKMTPTMRKVLEKLSSGWKLHSGWYHYGTYRPARIEPRPGKSLTVASPTFEKLKTAGLIVAKQGVTIKYNSPTEYVITPAGREALAQSATS